MKIAFLASRFPYPLDKGDKVRAYHQLKQLSQTNKVLLICLSESEVSPEHLAHVQQFCEVIKIYPIRKAGIALRLLITLFSALPFQAGYFFRPGLKKRIWADLYNYKPDAIICQLIRMGEYAKDYKHPNKVLDYMDVLSADMRRRTQVATGPKKAIFGIESKRVLAYETALYNSFQKHTIISTQDRDLLPVPDKTAIEVVPNGIDFGHAVGTEKKYDVLFFGNLNYTSNVESAVFLAQKVVSELVKTHPNVTVLIAGAQPHKRVLALQNNNIQVSGWVDDKWACFAAARVFVAPMLISVGMQNKILEAMAVSVPCVVTSMANNAIGAKNNTEVLVADDAAGFAAAIAKLLADTQFANQQAANAHAFISAHYTWPQTVAQLEKYLIK